MQANDLYVYCGNNSLINVDTNGNSYTNIVQDNKDGTYTITTTITVMSTDFKYKYEINNGVVLFDFEQNDYWDVLWRGGGEELAEAIFYAAKSISNDYLEGRTAGGINTELQMHWVAYNIGFMPDNASPANMGSLFEKIKQEGRDRAKRYKHEARTYPMKKTNN